MFSSHLTHVKLLLLQDLRPVLSVIPLADNPPSDLEVGILLPRGNPFQFLVLPIKSRCRFVVAGLLVVSASEALAAADNPSLLPLKVQETILLVDRFAVGDYLITLELRIIPGLDPFH